MFSLFFLKGILIGFSIALSVGPITILCITRTMKDGKTAGMAVGLGAATADGTYGLIAGFGLVFITNLMIEFELLIRIAGGIFLCYLGLKTTLTKRSFKKIYLKKSPLLKSFFETYLLTLTNPMTILFFMTIFAGLGIGDHSRNDYMTSSVFVFGVFMGSSFFYFLLIHCIYFFRTKMTDKYFAFGNKISGVMLGIFGIASISSSLLNLKL